MPSDRIQVLRGDITKVEVDAIVNAANSSLLGGGGVDGAIHRAGGPEILEDCRAIRARQGGCPTGEAVLTRAGKLPARFVIHTVGPVWRGGDSGELELLARAYRSCLTLAVEIGVRTIAFPNISTGIYGFPKRPAAEIALMETREFLEVSPLPECVLFVCFDRENYELYSEILAAA